MSSWRNLPTPTYACARYRRLGGDSDGERVTLRLVRPDLLFDLDRLTLGERFRFLMSLREPWESTSEEGERLRLRSRTGLTDRELVERARRRRDGVLDRDFDCLGDGELGLSSGVMDGEVGLGNLLLS